MADGNAKVATPAFENKVALVTGGSRGIGAATARLLAARGAAVAVNYHRGTEAAAELVGSLAADGARAIAVGADITDQSQVHAMVERVEAELGAVDILVLSASGITDLPVGPALKLNCADIEEVVRAQLKAFLNPVYAVAPGMVSRGRGSIVVVGASATRRPSPNFMSVAIAKAGLDAGVRTLAQELGPKGVRVNAVGPGLILTDASKEMPEEARAAIAQRSSVRRNGLPEDVAEVIAFLAADQASYLTGSYLLVDGGTAMV